MQDENNKEYSALTESLNMELMKNYNNYIASISMKNIEKINQFIDFGAGIGTISVILREKYKINPICIEIDKKNQKYLLERGLNFFDDLSLIKHKSDLIFSSNVLEHIKNDTDTLSLIKDSLNIEGKLCLYLPAKKILWSNLDEIAGHYRRYEISEIKKKCEQVGLRVTNAHYADFLGFFASLLMRFLGYDRERGIGSIKSLKFYDKWVFPISRFLDWIGCKYLIGKNLVLEAKKDK